MPHALIAAVIAAALATLSAARAETILISNEKDNTIAAIDGATLQLVRTVPVGERPRGIILSKDGRHLYVCAGDNDRVEVLDLETWRVIRHLPSGPDPELAALHPDGKRLFVANEDDNMVTVVDVERGVVLNEIPVGVEPEGMGMSPDGQFVVNTSETTNMAHVISTESGEIVANVLVDSRPRVALWQGDSKRFWVSAEIGGTVSLVDVDGWRVSGKVEFAVPGVPPEAIQPVGMVLSRDGQKLFVALGPANRVAVVDVQSLKVDRYLLVGQRVWNLALSPDGSRVYTTNGVSNDMSVIDVEAMRVVRSVPVGQLPWGVVVRP
jgi:PQQ-dependent catabolism-associated beta-propeller protein